MVRRLRELLTQAPDISADLRLALQQHWVSASIDRAGRCYEVAYHLSQCMQADLIHGIACGTAHAWTQIENTWIDLTIDNNPGVCCAARDSTKWKLYSPSHLYNHEESLIRVITHEHYGPW